MLSKAILFDILKEMLKCIPKIILDIYISLNNHVETYHMNVRIEGLNIFGATQHQNIPLLRKLLDQGVDVNLQNVSNTRKYDPYGNATKLDLNI